jgi:Zn-dependent protease
MRDIRRKVEVGSARRADHLGAPSGSPAAVASQIAHQRPAGGRQLRSRAVSGAELCRRSGWVRRWRASRDNGRRLTAVSGISRPTVRPGRLGIMTRALGRRSIGNFIFPGVVVIAVIAGFMADRTQLANSGGWIFLLVLSGWVITLCLHEVSHSLVALASGDFSVRARGYLTLNPIKYTNPVFTLIIPFVLLIAGGIPLPGGAVLIESHRLRGRGWSSLVSAAGPAANLLSGIILTVAVGRLSSQYTGLAAGLAFLAVLQFATFILNLLPVPGFDGFGIISPYLSRATQHRIAPIAPWAPLILFAILWSSPAVSSHLFEPANWLFDQFGGNRDAAGNGQYLFQFWKH